MITRNKPLLAATMRHIDAHPELHDQGDFIRRASNPCGTAMCYAGHAAVLAGATQPRDPDAHWKVHPVTGEALNPTSFWHLRCPDGTMAVPVHAFATEKLGLTEDESAALFSGRNSRDHLRKMITAMVEHDATVVFKTADPERVGGIWITYPDGRHELVRTLT